MAKKKLNKKAKTRIFLFFIIFGSIIGSLSYSFFSNVSKIIEIKNKLCIKYLLKFAKKRVNIIYK
mgnify:CR=1 FL=1